MSISILGIFVADLVFFGEKIPVEGETIFGKNFVIGPGGKGSNQAVAAAKAGAKTFFISKIGDDQFGSMATEIYENSGVDYSNVIISKDHSTGAAGILVNEGTGANAINVFPGAAGAITIEDIDKAEEAIKNSSIFLTQLEAPKDVVTYALKKAYSLNVKTILNPAPAAEIDESLFSMIDYFTPNETEASFYVDHNVETHQDAEKAAMQLLEKGIKNVIINDPKSYNSLSFNTINELIKVFKKLDKDNNTKVIILEGAGKGFSAGHNLKEVRGYKNRSNHLKLFNLCSTLMLQIVEGNKPVIAKVHGAAFAAGCQLAASCDLAYSTKDAFFATPGVNIGLFCSTPMVAVSRKINRKIMMKMLLTGEPIKANHAKEIGLINDHFSKSRLNKEVLKVAKNIASKSNLTIKIGKKAFYKQLEMPLREAYKYTSKTMTLNMMSYDAKEGISAFLQKRQPKWKNK